MLRERDFGDVAGARRFYGDERRAGLVDKARHNFIYWLARGSGDLVPEIFGRGVSVGVLFEISVYTFLKNVGTDVGFNRAQHRRGLSVGDAIEERFNIRGSFGLLADRTDRSYRVGRERAAGFLNFV